ncbi:hypothetical protein [Paenibacillus sp. LK1]|uniref:hypothetical protein n=1 Tax=Paenibacillus sp. LK1 TaxID=2053014 RepID=UPI000C1A2E06|nr:hypothetical protein [Paenibacillus sp. LK1]PIH58278.1 hypothetical protein CS562_17565 [Paenibacillus sp. LK1]
MTKAAKTLKYPVLEVFRDKDTKKKYPVDSVYETDNQDRADFLREFGYLGEPTVTDDSGTPSGDEVTVKPGDTTPDQTKPDSKTNSKADKE